MKLCFDSIDEVKAFVSQLKGTRGKKGEDDELAAASVASAPPVGGQPQMPQAFTVPQAAVNIPSFAQAPVVNPLVGQIITKLDGALASGQSVDMMTNWFRNLLGPDAAQANLDQIRTVFIPRLPELQLKQLAQQVGIPVT